MAVDIDGHHLFFHPFQAAAQKVQQRGCGCPQAGAVGAEKDVVLEPDEHAPVPSLHHFNGILQVCLFHIIFQIFKQIIKVLGYHFLEFLQGRFGGVVTRRRVIRPVFRIIHPLHVSRLVQDKVNGFRVF